jgi:ectoine hydroxylase-related dioxygenase (phytanoyl-CoA dioxygenase family)
MTGPADAGVDAEIAELERNGFIILPGLLSPSECSELVKALEPYEATRPMGRNNFEGEKTRRIYSLAGKGPIFMALAEHPRIVRLVDRLLLPNWLLSTMQSIRIYPDETPQPWHTDDAFYPIPRPHPRLALSVIWAIEPFTATNGATEVIPGSHLWGSEHPDDRSHTVSQAIMPAGSAIIFEATLWHRGSANVTGGTRLAISPQYCQPWLRPQESQLLIAPPDIAQQYSDRARSMLGYNIHPPFVGQVEGKHPLRLVDPNYGGRKTRAAKIADQVLERPVANMTAAPTDGVPPGK